MLETWIKSDLYQRQSKAITNFTKTLPSTHSNMPQQALKDPYIFDFLILHKEHLEHDLEQGLIDNVQKNHARIRQRICLSTIPSTRRQSGKLNFYLSAINDLVKGPEDQPILALIVQNKLPISLILLFRYAINDNVFLMST